jgi:hypothetical protein
MKVREVKLQEGDAGAARTARFHDDCQRGGSGRTRANAANAANYQSVRHLPTSNVMSALRRFSHPLKVTCPLYHGIEKAFSGININSLSRRNIAI